MLRSSIRRVIFGNDDTRIRATWRVLLGVVGILFLPQLLAQLFVYSIFDDPMGNHLLFGLTMAIGLGLFLLLFVGFARRIDHRSFRDYGIRFSQSWFLDGLAGFTTALIVIGVSIGLGMSAGWITFESVTDENILVLVGWGALVLFVYILGGSIMEGIVYTSIIGQNIAEGVRTRGGSARAAITTAVIGGGLLFSILHFGYGDPDAFGELPLTGPFFIWLVLGSLMILSYFWTGNVAFAIGLNAGINMGSWLFNPAGGLPGVQHVVMIERNPPAPFDMIGGMATLSMIAGYSILAVWVYYQYNLISRDVSITSKI